MEGVGDKAYIYPRRLLTGLTKAFQKKLNSGADQKYLSNRHKKSIAFQYCYSRKWPISRRGERRL